jgi:hypothetical protein
VSPRLVVDLASILKREPGAAARPLELRLQGETNVPSVAELLELGRRARRERASDAELLLAVGTLLALHAPDPGSVRH